MEDKGAGVCQEILKLEDSLWTFVYAEGVEPTNNSARHSSGSHLAQGQLRYR